MFRSFAIPALAFVALVACNGPAAAADQVFDNPSMFDVPIDWCTSAGGKCGSAAADLFCQSKGFSESIKFKKKATDDVTIYFASGKACTNGKCEALTQVTCTGGGLNVEASAETDIGSADEGEEVAEEEEESAPQGPNKFPQVVQTFDLGGQIKNDPSVVVNKANDAAPLAVFGRGMDDALWWATGDGVSDWNGWKKIGGQIKLAPGCVSHHSSLAGPKAYVIACFVVGMDDAIWYAEQDYGKPSTFGGFASLGGLTKSSPSAVAAVDEEGHRALYVFVRGLDNQLWYNQYRADVISAVDPVGWLGWTQIGYDMGGAPTCVSMGGNHIDCYFRDSAGQVVEAPDVFGRGPQTPLSGETEKRPGVMVSSDFKQVRILVKGMDDMMWVRSWKASSGFADWRPTELPMFGQPNCRSLGDGRASCISADADGKVKADIIPFEMVK
jgi:hypothetical protein